MDEQEIRILQHHTDGLCCSQILVAMALEDMGEENIPLVRSMAGLCNGLGEGGICGVAAGGVCVIALYTASGGKWEVADERFPLIRDQFMDWFTTTAGTRWGGSLCREILPDTGAIDLEVCGTIMTMAREKVLELLFEQGLDPSVSREEQDA